MKKILDRLLKRGEDSAPQAKQSASTAHEIALQHVRKKLKQIPDESDKPAALSAPAAGLALGEKAAKRRNENPKRRKAKEDLPSVLAAQEPRRRKKKAKEDLPYGLRQEKPIRRRKKRRPAGEPGGGEAASRRGKKRRLESFI